MDASDAPTLPVLELTIGTAVFIPGGVPHHEYARFPTEAIDGFTPVRGDYR